MFLLLVCVSLLTSTSSFICTISAVIVYKNYNRWYEQAPRPDDKPLEYKLPKKIRHLGVAAIVLGIVTTSLGLIILVLTGLPTL